MKLITNGSQLKCSMGMAPSSFNVLPTNQTSADQAPIATVQDCVPNMNVMPFGMCKSPANPSVAAATAANFGKLTPQPCNPEIMAPWAPPDPTFQINGLPILTDACILQCKWAGMIDVDRPAITFVSLERGIPVPLSLESSSAFAGLTKAEREAAIGRMQAARPDDQHHVAHQVVCDTTGAPLAGIKWRLRAPDGAILQEGATGSDGMIVAQVPYDGQYSFDYETGERAPEPAVEDEGSFELQEG